MAWIGASIARFISAVADCETSVMLARQIDGHPEPKFHGDLGAE